MSTLLVIFYCCFINCRERTELILHDSFLEFGRSGSTYTKNEILELLSREKGGLRVWSQDYALQNVEGNTALLTYRSAHVS